MLSKHNSKIHGGTCTMCGKENCTLTVIDDVDRVCDDCLDEEFTFCDECKEYWVYDAIEFFTLKDGRTICEHCAEDIDPGEIDSDDDLT